MKSENAQGLVIDLFSGIGGLSYGFKKVGFKLIGFEIDWKKVLTYELNVDQVVKVDVRRVNFEKFRGYVDYIISGPPCRPYSPATPKCRKGEAHPEYGLDLQVARVAKQVMPRGIVVEEVPTWNPEKLLRRLEKIGYRVSAKVISFSDYGVPSTRRRWILIGILDQDPDEVFYNLMSEKEKPPNPIDVLRDLPKEPNGHLDHRAYEVKTRRKELFKYIPPGYSFRQAYRANLIPEQLVKQLVKNPEGRPDYWMYRIPLKGLVKVIPKPRENRVLHPIYDRVLTVREFARLMTYPDTFSFKLLDVGKAMRAITESVPPKFSEKLAKTLSKLL